MIAAMASCSDADDSVPNTSDTEPIMHIMMTRATGEEYKDTTFRAVLHSEGGAFERQGTYCLPHTYDWLTPCAVTDSGKYDTSVTPTEDTKYGLRYGLHSGEHYLTIHSPAAALTDLTTVSGLHNVTTGAWGYRMNRKRGQGEALVKFSDPVSVTNRGVYLDSAYTFVATDIALHERRCKLKFEVQCGTDIDQCVVHKLDIEDLIKEAYYEPGVDTCAEGSESPYNPYRTGDFAYDNSESNLETEKIYTASDDNGTTVLQGKTLEGIDDKEVWLFPMDYETRKEGVNQRWHPVPTMRLTIRKGNTDEKTDCVMPIPYNLEPQTTYLVRMLVNSVYVQIKIYASTWSKGADEDIEVNNPPQFYTEFTANWWTNKTNKADDITTE